MLLEAILIIAAGFGLILLARLGGAWRKTWLPRWPAVAFAIAAIVLASRGAISMALSCAAIAAGIWLLARARPAQAHAKRQGGNAGELAARAILGVSAEAGDAEIRRAYRAKMAKAHPDQGGAHADAAAITAARDLLLGKPR